MQSGRIELHPVGSAGGPWLVAVEQVRVAFREDWIPAGRLRQISEVIGRLGGDRFKPIRDALRLKYLQRRSDLYSRHGSALAPDRIGGMFRLLCAVLLAGSLAAQRKPVTIDAVTAKRPPEFGSPVWAADGKRFLYTVGKKVWEYDIPARERKEKVDLGKLEGLARKPTEPEKFGWQNRNVGEANIQWSPSGRELMLRVDGDLFWHTLETGATVQLTSTREDEADPRLSPDARHVSFRSGRDLDTLEIATKKRTRLTFDGSATLWNAELDWVYPEELKISRAHWWSPDSRSIAYLQFDVSRLNVHPQVDQLRGVFEPQLFPKAGTPNSSVKLGVVPVGGKRTRWMSLPAPQDMLIARVAWFPDSRSLAVVRVNRVQNRLEFLAVDVATGTARLLFEEKAPSWINVTEYWRILEKTKRIVWSSERDGFQHLYLYSWDGNLERQLTRGEWESSLVGVDEARGRVYFLSTAPSVLERQLYSVAIEGGEPVRMTKTPGVHSVTLSPSGEYYLDAWSSLTDPPRTTVHTADGAEWSVYREPDLKPAEEYELLRPEIVPVKATDGTTLYARLITPAGFQAGRKYPAIVFVYGGPGPQTVRNQWSGVTFDQAMAHSGFVIWQLDNRGSSGRGHAWESKLYRRMGKQELEDQKRGVEHLISLGFVDATRVGIHGSSYGGFMTLTALLHAPETFRAGVAGAPLTDWRLYDTIYTERYLGLPSENEEGYKASSPLRFADKLSRPLMLLHNLEDDNVLLQHTVRMADALQQAGKQFELMVYPQKTHAVTGVARKHQLTAIASFFERHLKAQGAAPSP